MIVRQFLHWIKTAPACERAEATTALARAFLVSDLSVDDRLAAEAAMVTLLDDPSPEVRLALAHTLSGSEHMPLPVLQGLMLDEPDVVAAVVSRSPLILDGELVEALGTGTAEVQAAIAARRPLSAPVSAALCEVGTRDVCLVLLANDEAELLSSSLDRLFERFSDDAQICGVLSSFEELSAATSQALIDKRAESMVQERLAGGGHTAIQIERLRRDALDEAIVDHAARLGEEVLKALTRHLRQDNRLTGSLLLRSLLCGSEDFVAASLAELSGLPFERTRGVMSDHRGSAFRALCQRAGLPSSTLVAFRCALEALRANEGQAMWLPLEARNRLAVEACLSLYAPLAPHDFDASLVLLRRLAAECARQEARRFTSDLLAPPDEAYDVEAPPLDIVPQVALLIGEGDVMLDLVPERAA
jgi:uncharacterized protein (DUF2336 family)